MSFVPQGLLGVLRRYPSPKRYRVAYSGGVDSHALLSAMTELQGELDAPVDALHVDHGLHPHSGDWAAHCRETAGVLGVSCQILTVAVSAEPGESPEAAARRVRYRALAGLIAADECLLTAHHADDQTETLLLQLFRGGGPHGLAAMPEWRQFGAGWHLRPLLDVDRVSLRAYAESRALNWIDDASNADVGYDRNYLRHVVVPAIEQRWPSITRTAGRAARQQAKAAGLLDEVADADRVQAQGERPEQLRVPALAALPRPRQENLLRRWMRYLGLPVPSAVQLEQALDQMLDARRDATPRVHWPGAELRRYRDRLYAMPPMPPHDPRAVLSWDGTTSLHTSAGTLAMSREVGRGLRESVQGEAMTVRFRRGGELCRPGGSDHSRTLKKLCQQWGVPPWLRDRLPLIYVGDDLAAVADLCVCEPFCAGPQEAGLVIHWHRLQAVPAPDDAD